MRKLVYKIWSNFLTAFGNIRISKVFPWLYYDTTDFKVKGDKILEIMDILEPGMIINRGYDSYLDGKFIDDPLSYSHSSIYIGDNKIIHAVAEGVSVVNVIDFCQCDRIAIFKPKNGQKKAVKIAKSFLGMDYDFSFNNTNSALYCFELAALCYPKLNIKPVTIKKFGFIKKTVYLSKSFLTSKDLDCIFQYNPKFNIDFRKSQNLINNIIHGK